MFKKLGIGCGTLIAIIVVIAIIASATSGGGGKKTPTTEVAASTTTAAAEPTPTPNPAQSSNQPLAVGQAAQVGDANVVLDKARVSSDQSQTRGNEILLLEFRVTYTGKQSYNLSSLLQFALFGQDDRKYNPTIALDANGSLDGTLQPGQSQLGEVAFDVPTANAPFKAEFEQVLGTKSAKWTVPQP